MHTTKGDLNAAWKYKNAEAGSPNDAEGCLNGAAPRHFERRRGGWT